MSEINEMQCPICNKIFTNGRQRASHFWNLHKIKYSEYVAGNSAINNVIDEMNKPDIVAQQPQVIQESKTVKPAEALFQPTQITEAKEFVNEAPAVVIDKELMKEAERKDTDFVKAVRNPYKDLYNDGGQVLNEWL